MARSHLSLRRVRYPADDAIYDKAWWMMHKQPELYANVVGFDVFAEFAIHSAEQIDFALEAGDQLIAFASLVLKGKGICEFELITPPRPRVRSILALLRQLQASYFEDLGHKILFAIYPDDPVYDRTKQLVRAFGWREAQSDHFEFTIADYLRLKNGEKAENRPNALRAKQ